MLRVLHGYFYFQDALAELFPSWNDIMRYKETLKFAVGVSDNKETLVEFLYISLIQHATQQTAIPKYMLDPEISFLSEVLQGVPETVGNDPRHCKFISYTTETDTTVNIPAKLYVFGPGVEFGAMAHHLKNLSKLETLNISGKVHLPAEMGQALSAIQKTLVNLWRITSKIFLNWKR